MIDSDELKKLLESKPVLGGVLPPMSLGRWTVDAIADQLAVSADEAREALDALVGTFPRDEVIEKRLGRCARRHVDGTYSYSHPTTYEELRHPEANELEAMLASGAYAEVDAALAEVGVKAPGWEPDAPSLRWSDGSELSAGARAWYFHNLAAKTHYRQLVESDRKRAVRGAWDMLRGAFDDESVRALAAWVLDFRGKGGPRAFPLDPVAVRVVDERLASGAMKKLPGHVLDTLMSEPSTRRVLLRAGIIGPHKWVQGCHDAWPPAIEEVERAEWEEVAERFLDEATSRGLTLPWATLREHYLGPVWLRTKVVSRALRTKEGGDVRLDSEGVPTPALADDALLRFVDARPADASPPPRFPDEPMNVEQFKARCEKAGLRIDRTNIGAPYAFVVDPLGTLMCHPTGYGQGFGGHEVPVRIQRLEAKGGSEILWSYSPDTHRGWEALDPTWRELIRGRLEILLAPAASERSELMKGARVRIVNGKSKGAEGVVFWYGESKYGDGMRVGVRDGSGSKHWAGAEDVELTGEGISHDG